MRQAKLTKAQVDQLTKRILADLKALDRQGITIIKFGGDDGGGPHHIGVQGADQHRAFLQARYGQYGPGTVEIVERQPLIPFSRAQAR